MHMQKKFISSLEGNSLLKGLFIELVKTRVPRSHLQLRNTIYFNLTFDEVFFTLITIPLDTPENV